MSIDPQCIEYYRYSMRTTLDLPEALVEEARATLGGKSKTDTIIFPFGTWSAASESRN
jgi:hypothetical protein